MWNVKAMRTAMQLLAGSALCLLVSAVSLPEGVASPTVAKPRSLTTSEIAKFKKALQGEIQVALDLAGIGKQALPPEYSNKLKTYRTTEAVQRKNPSVAPFLGFWVQDWSTFPPQFAMHVLPSSVKGRVCMIEYQYNDTSPPPPGETVPPNPPPKFSTATVVKDQVVGSSTRLARSLILPTRPNWVNRNIEFLGAVTAKNQVQIYAAKDVPKLDLASLPANVQQQFKLNQCIAAK
jgi:hypothetical protein